MSRVLVIYEGIADQACAELEGATPLEIARSPNASKLAARGAAGMLVWPERDPARRTEQALATLLGVQSTVIRHVRRGPVEAAGTAIDPSRWTYAYRGNFITTDEAFIREDRVAELTIDETEWLAKAVMESWQGSPCLLEVTGPGRAVVTFDRVTGEVDPGDFPEVGLPCDSIEDRGWHDRRAFIQHSARVLAPHSINQVRVDLGENPASMLWLWGGGSPVALGRPFIGAPLKAAMIGHGPLARGMANLCGMSHLALGNPWADTIKPDLLPREELVRVIRTHELTVVYVEAPREAGAYGSPVDKVKSIDRLDIHVLARVVDAWNEAGGTRLMLTALPEDGVIMARTPVILCGSRTPADSVVRWDETSCPEGALGDVAAERCISKLVGD